MIIKHCEFINNNNTVMLGALGGKSLNFDNIKFINNTGGLLSISTSMIHISHSEFVDNIVSQSLILLTGTKTISVANSHFSGNANTAAGSYYYYPSLIGLEGLKIDLYFIEFVNNN